MTSPLSLQWNFAHPIDDDSFEKCVRCYPSQTKILEGGTKDEMRISKEALFKGVSTPFGPLTIEKSSEHPQFIFCSSFQNLRWGSIHYVGYHALKSASKRRYGAGLHRHSEQKIARFCTHDLTKGLSYVSTQPSGHVPMTLIYAPKRCIWNEDSIEEQKMKCGFRRKHFSKS